MITPLAFYQQQLKDNKLQEDIAQAHAVKLTQSLFEALTAPQQKPHYSLLSKFLKKSPTNKIKGLYLWGGVGRGKSLIVDTFYDCLPFSEKLRIHFNPFMQSIHHQLRELPKTPDPLIVIAKQFASRYRVVCLDEFHVNDIADAMIMAGLLQALFAEGLTIVTTSNIEPEALYENGLQRDRFLPAIDLIIENNKVFHLDSKTDYRLLLLEQEGSYHECAPHESLEILQTHLDKLANAKIEYNTSVRINDREIRCKARNDSLIWFEFADICQTARSSVDYIQLTREYQTILLSNIPIMDEGQNDSAQRFIQFIDAVYDHKINFIATAMASPDHIYTGKSLAFAFQRITSRLHEMRSKDYLMQTHIPG